MRNECTIVQLTLDLFSKRLVNYSKVADDRHVAGATRLPYCIKSRLLISNEERNTQSNVLLKYTVFLFVHM